MSLVRDDLPYSRKGLEDLASALRINSCYLWVNPVNARLELKDSLVAGKASVANNLVDEDEIDEAV